MSSSWQDDRDTCPLWFPLSFCFPIFFLQLEEFQIHKEKLGGQSELHTLHMLLCTLHVVVVVVVVPSVFILFLSFIVRMYFCL